MTDYSDMSTGQLYELLLLSITNQLNGIESSAKVKSIKEVADIRDINLYQNAFDNAMSSYNPKVIVKSDPDKTPKHIEAIKDSLESTKYKLAKVVGNSMVKKDIAEGDYVMYDKSATIRNSDVVIAKYKAQIFIKSYYNSQGSITLKSNNPTFSDIEIDLNEDFEILGKVIMLLKDI